MEEKEVYSVNKDADFKIESTLSKLSLKNSY